jgi:trehalose 6-phosphate phosphatase
VIHLFSEAGRRTLRAFAKPDTLVALDYDGTLAPIADDPFRAHMHAATRELLIGLVRCRPSVILTGRSRRDALRLLDGIDGIEVIGNHGMESLHTTSLAILDLVSSWKPILMDRIAAMVGMSLEDKGYSLSLHYRLAPDPLRAAAFAHAIAATLPRARLLGGKCVLNIVPADAPDKGQALLEELQRTALPRAVFVGDDVTDEDVFSLDLPQQILSVRVGHSPNSRAQYFLHDRNEVDQLLSLLTLAAYRS